MDIEKLHNELKAKNWSNVKALCRLAFGCSDEPLDQLSGCLTENGFFELCKALEQIRSAAPHDRPAKELGLNLVLDGDMAPDATKERAIQAARTIWQAFPTR